MTVSYHSLPEILKQPESQLGYCGRSATFSVTATNSPPFGYQWQKDGVPLVGATASSLVLTNLQFTNSGSYTVVVANLYGSVTSAPPAILTVIPAGVSLALYPGVTIDGVVGQNYGVQYTTDLGNTNS